MSRVVVIGGGISGLASAALLARDGHEVTILEGRDQTGGRAGSWESGGFRFDLGPSWYLMPEVFDHFFKLLGTSADEQLKLVTLDPGYRVVFEGSDERIDIAASKEENLDLFERIEPGSRPVMEKYLESARDTYEIAKERFLYTSFADLRPLMRRDVLTRMPRLARLLLQPLATLVAKTVKDDRLRKILGFPAVFLGSSPFITPSMYHLMSHLDLADGVLYPMGGLYTLIERIDALSRAEGVQVITGARVTRILVSGDGQATGVEYTDASGVTKRFDADVVVSAADLHHTETTLLPRELQTYPQEYWDKRTPGPGGLLVYLGVKGEVPELEHHNMFFAEEWEVGFDRIFGAETSIPHPASLYVCKPSGIDPSVAPDGDTNLFILVPIPSDPTIGRGEVDGDGDPQVEAAADKFIAQVAEWAKIPDLAERIIVRRTLAPGDFATDLNSWQGTLLGPAHTLKQSALFRAGNISKKVRGLYYVGGSTIPGIGLPMCVISAEVLLKRIRGDVSTEPLPEPMPRAARRAMSGPDSALPPAAPTDSPSAASQSSAAASSPPAMPAPRKP